MATCHELKNNIPKNLFVNKCKRKPKEQSRMDNAEALATGQMQTKQKDATRHIQLKRKLAPMTPPIHLE